MYLKQFFITLIYSFFSIVCAPWQAATAGDAFIPRLINSSTVPGNGDLNPYGVAFVPQGFPQGGAIAAGDVLVANFNSSSNLQGTGTTIVEFSPQGPIAAPGAATVFYESPLWGLSTALGALRGGFVVVGNVPTTNGKFSTIGQGALQVLNRTGTLVATWTDAEFLDGPWDLALNDHGSWAHIFVSNVLNGTVSRLTVAVDSTGVTLKSKITIATGYSHRPNSAALVLGPTGLAFDANTHTLYVASTADNAIYAVADADERGTPVHRGVEVFTGPPLRGPLALRFAPNGDLLAANGDAVGASALHPSEIIEFTAGGQFVRGYNVDPSEGGAFGIDALSWSSSGFNYAVIDDVTNSLAVYQLPVQ